MNTFLFIGIFIVMFTAQNILDIGCEPSQDLLDHDLREAHDKEMQAYDAAELKKKSVLQIQSLFRTSSDVLLQESNKESVSQIQSSFRTSSDVLLQESKEESILQIQSVITASYEDESISDRKFFSLVRAYSDIVSETVVKNGVSLDEKDRKDIYLHIRYELATYLEDSETDSEKNESEIIDDLYSGETITDFKNVIDNTVDHIIYSKKHGRTH